MDTLNVNTIEPEGGTTTINVGLSGKNVIITDNLKANTLKDAGGNTIFTSNGSGVLSSVNSGFGSAQVLLSTQTANNSSGVEFTSGIDGTYKEMFLILSIYIQMNWLVLWHFKFLRMAVLPMQQLLQPLILMLNIMRVMLWHLFNITPLMT